MIRFPLLRRALSLLPLLPLLAAAPALALPAASDPIAVLYPDIGQPYRKVFTEIIDGVERQAHAKVNAVAVGATLDAAELQAGLKRNGTRTVIALGRQGLKAAATFDGSFNVIVGGVSALPDPERWRGISLAPDPNLLFTWLKALVPGVRRVIVVYNPQQNSTAIPLAREAARGQGLELTALDASDLAAAVRRYEAVFATADGKHDAVWLPQDSVTVDDTTILPLVLRESWNRGVVLFSSSIVHVRKGVLFALYPDHVALGRELAALAQLPAPPDTSHPGLQPLRAVHVAFNVRTASHLGLDVDSVQHPLHPFDAVFP